MKRWCLVVGLLVGMGWGQLAQAATPKEEMGPSTVLGGSLLDLGEVALTFGAGFPDLMFRFDFANSKRINLAFQTKINYSFGMSHFGGHIFVTAPVRFGIIQSTPLSFAVSVESGAFFGGGQLERLFFGIPVELAGLFSLALGHGWVLNFGLELPMTFSFEGGNTLDPFGWNIAMEGMVGAEYRLNSSLSFFAKLAGGPHLFVGNIASLLDQDAKQTPNGVFVSASLRLLVGIAWRR